MDVGVQMQNTTKDVGVQMQNTTYDVGVQMPNTTNPASMLNKMGMIQYPKKKKSTLPYPRLPMEPPV